jgi:diguanylate cyclase (GGDEF)-like protein/PAS domain S-box-containing protein
MQPAPEFEYAAQAVSVLLVEDDPDFAALVRRCVAGLSGRPALRAAHTLEEALHALRSGVLDLVLADLGLPDSSGLDTLQRIAAATTCPIIVLTANDDPGLREAALGVGAYEFLHKKDFDSQVLARLVRLAAIQARTFRSLRQSEARFRSLTQLSADWYWEQDSDFRLTFMSSRMVERTGLAAAPYLGRKRWDLPALNLSEADWQRHRAQLERHEPFRDFEMQRKADDGASVWLSISGEPIYDAAGGFSGYRGIGRDITAQKRADQLQRLEHGVTRCLAEAETATAGVGAVLRAICETLGWECGRYFELDQQAGVLRFVAAWGKPDRIVEEFLEASRTLTYKRGEGLSGHVWQSGEPLWVGDVATDPRASGSSRRATGRAALQGASFVFPVISHGQTLGVMSFSSGDPKAPNKRLGEALGVIGTQGGQFLQRKHAEAALRVSEERFRETFELAGSGIAQVSLDGKFVRVNRSLCRILGYAEHELIGRSVKELSHPADRDPDDSQRMRFEKRYIRKDGSTAWVDLTKAIARDSEGRPAYDIVVMDDITEQKAAQAALLRFRTAFDRSADMFFLVDMKDGRLLDFNETACTALGYERDELIGSTPDLFLAGHSLEDVRALQQELLRERTLTGELTYRRKDGSTFPVEARRTVLDTPDGPVLVVNSHDLTERKIEEARKSAHLRYQQRIAAFGQLALVCRDPQELAENAVQQVLLALGAETVAYVERGTDPGQLVARALAGADAGAGRTATGEDDPVSQVLETGVRFSAESCSTPFEWARTAAAAIVPVPGDSSVRGALCAVSRAREFGLEELNFLDALAAVLTAGLKRVTSEERLAFLAQFDSLTGLPNRTLLADRFAQMIEQTRRRGVILGVLFVDLDDFKSVNDTLGHAAGDELLKQVARRLEEALRPGDTVARISGDEFALVLADLARQEDAALVAQKIVDRLAAPFQLAGQEVCVSASVGIASYPADGQDAETLLGAADAAMYRAKQSGRNSFQFFTAEINQRTKSRALLGAELRRALERGEFALAYQPKYDLLTMRACGAEALLRWNHPERGVVMPAQFVPVLEEMGLIVPVGEWVLRRACEDIQASAAAGMRPVPVAVNLSARQFRQHDLGARIRALIAGAAVSPDLIELEITESHLMHDPAQAIHVMRALRDEGIRITIDDFGTGYSSLAYLTRFPVAALKIDRSFVAGIGRETSDPAIVRTIIEMARTLGATVIAEGVETAAQMEFLRQHGCHQAQGYFFARPMPVEDFRALISSATDGASGKGLPASRNQ